MLRMFFALPLLLTACQPDETVSAYANPQAIYRLTEIDAALVSFRATMRFADAQKVKGEGPCNIYSARLATPYPWFELDQLVVTERACAGLRQEQVYLDALAAMELAEVSGPSLVLTNDAGREMVFLAEN